jgi:hypothetical protein
MRLRGRERVSTAVSGWLPQGAPYVFTPLDLSPALWLDASDATTITSSGSPAKVSQWNDKSGNGYNVAQGTGANQPTTGATTKNGLNVLDFDGSNDVLISGTVAMPSGNTARTAVVVSKRTTGGFPFMYGSSATNKAWGIDQGFTANMRVAGFANDWDTGIARTTNWEVLAAWHDGTNVRFKRSDAATVGPNARTYDTDATPFYVGRPVNIFAGTWLNGSIAEVLIFNTALSTTELQAVYDYLNAKWSVF